MTLLDQTEKEASFLMPVSYWVVPIYKFNIYTCMYLNIHCPGVRQHILTHNGAVAMMDPILG